MIALAVLFSLSKRSLGRREEGGGRAVLPRSSSFLKTWTLELFPLQT